MPRLSLVGLLFAAALLSLPAQEEGSPKGPVKVYAVKGDVAAPEVLPINFTTAPCDSPLAGEVQLAAIVDVTGIPRNAMFTRATGTDLDKLALNVLAAEKFKPAEQKGVPVPAAETIAIKLESCIVQAQNGTGGEPARLRLRSQPELRLLGEDIYPGKVIYAPEDSGSMAASKSKIYRVNGDVSAPLVMVASKTIDIGGDNDSANRKVKYQGMCLLSLIVDAHGMPQEVKEIRPIGLGLDQKAIDLVERYRFKPAMLKGREPVPVAIVVEVNFRLYKRPD